MRNETQLPQGQLNPAARPVDAFLQPVNYQVAQPSQLPMLGNTGQIQTIQTGGTPNVQGYNNAALLAESLAPFSRELNKTVQSAGLAYAGWQMQKGEAEFMEAYRRAQVNVDQQGEVGESQYAKASREVYAKDKDAGWGMWLANPYREMGAQRARSRLAGQEVQYRMEGIQGQIGGADYESPDQGFGKLQSLRAGLISQVTQAWGVDENSAGFQKYAAPAIEKASERAGTQLAEDRRKYFDEMKPKQLAELLRNEIYVEETNKRFEYKGKEYVRGQDPDPLYWQAWGLKQNDLARDFLSKAGPGGMASKWARDAYGILQADANFKDDAALLGRLGRIQSSEPLRGVDGKPAIGFDGQPVYLTWDQLYRQENIDSQIKYQQAGYTLRSAQAKDLGERGGAAVSVATEGMLPGPDRFDQGLGALNQFVLEEEERLGRKLTAVERLQIRKAWKDANDLNDQLVFEQDDPAAPTRFLGELGQQYGTAFNAARSKAEAERIALGMRDQAKGQQFLMQAYAQIERKEKEVQDFSGYSSSRDKVINDNIEARLRRNYDYSTGSTDPKADREESTRRQRLAYTTHVNERIREKEAAEGRKLTDTEVRSITQTAIDEYGKNDKDGLGYLFPGSRAYPDSPSVDPYSTIIPTPLGPDGKPKGPEPPKGPDGKPLQLYGTSQLDDIPNRRVVLRQFRDLPVMSLGSLRDLVFDGIAGKPLSMKFERAWRDAGARNAFEFLQEQLGLYQNYTPEWSQQDWKKLQQRLQSSAATQNAAVAHSALSPMPALASLASWSFNTLVG